MGLLDSRLLFKIAQVVVAVPVGSEPWAEIAAAALTETVGIVGGWGVGYA
jgi:hypothetical protein